MDKVIVMCSKCSQRLGYYTSRDLQNNTTTIFIDPHSCYAKEDELVTLDSLDRIANELIEIGKRIDQQIAESGSMKKS